MPTKQIQLQGYQVYETIYDGARTVVYRGYQTCDQKPVVIKLLKNPYPSFTELLQFKNQYNLIRQLELPGVVSPYSLEPYQNSFALVMEDFGGISLKEYAQGTPALEEVLQIAIALADILDKLYQHHILHKDIKPANVLIHPITKQVKLIDFSVASRLPRETQTLTSPTALEGTLAYLSPEQTGRMNRGIDYRTDFYSLGITCFELLTGKLPFDSDDPLELVHCHIAKQPPAVHQLNDAVPPMVSAIVSKLMAKNAEDRYQSALGLKYDLELCLQQLQSGKQIEGQIGGQILPFELGQRDISNHFTIPEKLYGRESEVAELLAAFDRVAGNGELGQSELILIAGFSGIGKTAVVNEVHKPILQQRGYFIKGKFDQFQRNIPFSAFVQAFCNLVEQLLTESDAQLERWKLKLLKALGDNAQVIVEVIPELEQVIGEQPAVPELSGLAIQNRFNALFQKFIQVFTTPEHPLVIFLDDLQWADTASLKLMQLLMSDAENHHLLMIGAYRDNEVSLTHPLMLAVEEIGTAGTTVSTITLANLNVSDVNRLVADTLSCTLSAAEPLSERVNRKTKGNPFFVTQFLKSLYEDQLIIFERQNGCWQWNLEQINILSMDDDVVGFMQVQLEKLPDAAKNLLKLAACIGNQFELATLAVVYERSPHETAVDLWAALQEGFVIPIGDEYKMFHPDEGAIASELPSLDGNGAESTVFRFLHDRVQQAAYLLIPADQKQATHLRIGRLLLKPSKAENHDEQLFEVVNQLNLGAALIQDLTERQNLAQLNLLAGRKAVATTAYALASEYFGKGQGFLSADAWDQTYELTLDLYSEAVEVAYLNGQLELMDRLAEQVLQRARTLLDQIQTYEVKIQAYVSQNQLLEARSLGLLVLGLLGIDFPKTPDASDLERYLQSTQAEMAHHAIDDLIELPTLNLPDKLAAMRILATLISITFVSYPSLLPLVICEQVNLSLRYGNSPWSTFAYANYGLLLCATGDTDTGHQLGQLAIALLNQLDAKTLKAKTFTIVYSMTHHWQQPLSASLDPLLDGYHSGLETGDLEYAAYGILHRNEYAYFCGWELSKLAEQLARYGEALTQIKQIHTVTYSDIYRQAVLNLVEAPEDPIRLVGTAYDEGRSLPIHQQADDRYAIYQVYLQKLILSYLFGDLLQAVRCADLAEQYLDSVSGLYFVPAFYFYDALLRLAVYPGAEAEAQPGLLEKAQRHQDQIKQWANSAPSNFLHKWHLIEAERCRLAKQFTEAIAHYDLAIAEAAKYHYVQEEALACELAGRFYLGWGKAKIAQVYLTDAYYAYTRWGAKAKVNQLEQEYPTLLTSIAQPERSPLKRVSLASTTSSSALNSSLTRSSVLDLITVIKASQALAGEIHLEKLLAKLMRIVIENAGAQKSTLLLFQKQEWVVAAQADNETETIPSPSVAVDLRQVMPQSILNYVARTGETLVLEDARTEPPFSTDAYIIQQQPKSVLCTPIRNQGKLVGVLYLENHLTVGAFTSDRLEILQLLMSQAAISLQNATLYNTLEQTVEQRTQELHEKNQRLSNTLDVLQRTQTQLIQTEKMSSLGQMVAGVAHEINNPVNFIHGNIIHAETYFQELFDLLDLYQTYYSPPVPIIQKMIDEVGLDFLQEDLQKLLKSMKVGADRICQIVLSLRNFSRLDEAEMKPVDIHEGIDSTLLILQHRLKAKVDRPEIQVVKEYGKLPEIDCYASQLNQVFMNVLNNAIDALEDSRSTKGEDTPALPQVRIRTTLAKNTVTIRIADNGIGMSPEVLQRLFDPFFTTKPVGKGTGLGMSICYAIMEKHQGRLEVQSTLGQGTEFTISIPLSDGAKFNSVSKQSISEQSISEQVEAIVEPAL